MPHPGSDYQNWKGEPLPRDPRGGVRCPYLVSERTYILRCSGGDAFDDSPSVEALCERYAPMARRMASSRERPGLDRDDLESEAMYALLLAAQSHEEHGYEARTFRAYAKKKIASALSELAATSNMSLLGVPKGKKRAAIKIQKAAASLSRRGIHRPNALQLAGESRLPIEEVEEVLAIPGVVPIQSVDEWAYGRWSADRQSEPTLVPMFGPSPGFSPQATCADIHGVSIPRWSHRCCMVCHESGMDHHPALQRDPDADPKPEPKRRAAKPTAPLAHKAETRADRRQLLFPPSNPAE